MARSKMIMVRVDEAEHALFKEAARRVSISMSEYARDAMLARMALEEVGGVVGPVPGPVETAGIPAGLGVGAVEDRPKETRTLSQGGTESLGGSQSISSPGEVPAAVERVAGRREFTPYSKEQQTGRVVKKEKPKEVPGVSCRHGLLRCKVCGTHP